MGQHQGQVALCPVPASLPAPPSRLGPPCNTNQGLLQETQYETQYVVSYWVWQFQQKEGVL